MSRRIRFLFPLAASLAALALIAGCGNDEESEPDAAPDDAPALSGISIEGDGYSFELAEGYEEGDTAPFDDSLGAVPGSTIDALATGETLNSFATNVNVVIVEPVPDGDLDQIVEDSLDGLQEQLDSLGVPAAEIEVSVEPFETTLGGEDARQYDFVTTTDAGTYTQRQIIALRDDRGYTVTFSADAESFEGEAADFDSMMETWAWG